MLALNQNKSTTSLKDSDVEVNAEDQQKINRFARLNNRLDDIRQELIQKETELHNLQDAGDEIELLDDSDGAVIPFQMGSVFIQCPVDEIQGKLGQVRTKLEDAVKGYRAEVDKMKQEMSQLKVDLYGKFGTSINLEPDED